MGHKKVFKENSFRGGGDGAMPCKGLLLFTKQQCNGFFIFIIKTQRQRKISLPKLS